MSTTHVVQFVVESAGVANWLAGLVPPPESRGRRLAVGAAGARPSRRTLQRQFWKREDTDITPVTINVSDDHRARIVIVLIDFNPSNVKMPFTTSISSILFVLILIVISAKISLVKFFFDL